jgi:hypothetical protein
MSFKEWNQEAYEAWEDRVSRILVSKCGLALWELPDLTDTAALWEAGETPAQAAATVLRAQHADF